VFFHLSNTIKNKNVG